MFVAGGYGALRKTPSGAGSLDTVAAAGMAVHGIASIFTILGGAAFVIVAIRALWRAGPAALSCLTERGTPSYRRLLQLGRAQMDDRKAEEGERQRLMGQRKLDRNDGEQRRDAERDLEQSNGREDDGAARERRARRGAQRSDRLNNREGDDSIGDHPVIELRRRRIAEDRLQRDSGETPRLEQGSIPSAARCCR